MFVTSGAITTWIALGIWPVLAILFFRSMPLPKAVCVTLLGGYLLLPTATYVDLPGFPRLDKVTIPALVTVLLVAAFAAYGPKTSHVLKGWIPRSTMPLVFLAMIVLGAFGTVATNGEPLFYGPRYLRGMTPYDGFSLLLTILTLALPLFIGRRVLATAEAGQMFLKVIVVSAALYSILALYEVRMSPQLNQNVYGFFPHNWLQHVRSGGFRPVVFLNHGLLLSLYLAMATVASFGLSRIVPANQRRVWILLGFWLGGTLLLSKSFGAVVLTVFALGLLYFTPRRALVTTAAIIAGIIIFYPIPRTSGLIPTDGVVSLVEKVNPARAGSLATRLHHEDKFLEKAKQKPILGWGTWGRERVYDDLGIDRSISDGFWVVQIAAGGWVRYIGIMGLLCFPIIALGLSKRGSDPTTVILILLLTINLIDTIPNSAVTPLTWLLVGALYARLEYRETSEQHREVEAEDLADTAVATSRYSRKETVKPVYARPRKDGLATAKKSRQYSRTHPGMRPAGQTDT